MLISVRLRVVTQFEIVFFFNDTATTEIYTLSLHDALPIFRRADGGHCRSRKASRGVAEAGRLSLDCVRIFPRERSGRVSRSEEHTSELQSRQYLVCRLLLEKKKKKSKPTTLQQSRPTLLLH